MLSIAHTMTKNILIPSAVLSLRFFDCVRGAQGWRWKWTSPVVQVELWCFNSVRAGGQGKKKHSPHGLIDSVQYLTGGGTYTD